MIFSGQRKYYSKSDLPVLHIIGRYLERYVSVSETCQNYLPRVRYYLELSTVTYIIIIGGTIIVPT